MLEVVRAFKTARDRKVPYGVVDRREVDAAVPFSNAGGAANSVRWHATCGLDVMCRGGWRSYAHLWSEIYPRRQT